MIDWKKSLCTFCIVHCKGPSFDVVLVIVRAVTDAEVWYLISVFCTRPLDFICPAATSSLGVWWYGVFVFCFVCSQVCFVCHSYCWHKMENTSGFVEKVFIICVTFVHLMPSVPSSPSLLTPCVCTFQSESRLLSYYKPDFSFFVWCGCSLFLVYSLLSLT